MTKNKLPKKQCSFYCNAENLKKYQELYPNTLTFFLGRCISAALEDQELFNKIFWNFKE